MIKHDYQPQNNKNSYTKRILDRLPAWASHPFKIIFMAILLFGIAIMLSDDTPTPEKFPTNPKPIVIPSYIKGDIPLDTHHSDDRTNQDDTNRAD